MNGLKNQVPAILESLNSKRKSGDVAANFRSEFRGHIADEKLTVAHLFHELGISAATSLAEIDKRDDTDTETKKAQKSLVKEILTNAVNRGAGASLASAVIQNPATYQTPEYVVAPVQQGSIDMGFYSELVALNSPAPTNVATVPRIPVQSDMGMDKSSEMAKGNRTRIVTNSKTVQWSKTKKVLEMSDEAIKRHRISLLQIYFEQLGMFIASNLNTDLTAVALSGDQSDLSESSAVIGIATANTLIYKDLVKAFVRMSRLGLTPTAILASEAMTITLLDMLENKQRQNVGSPLLSFTPKQMLPENLPIYTGPNVPTAQFILIAQGSAFAQETSQALMLETDRDIDAQFDFTVASMETGFWNIRREARLTVDTSLAISGATNDFPSWFNATA